MELICFQEKKYFCNPHKKSVYPGFAEKKQNKLIMNTIHIFIICFSGNPIFVIQLYGEYKS
jgi:hypothetical protein